METQLFFGKVYKAVHTLNQADLEKALTEFCKKNDKWLQNASFQVEFQENNNGNMTCYVTQQVYTELKDAEVKD